MANKDFEFNWKYPLQTTTICANYADIKLRDEINLQQYMLTFYTNNSIIYFKTYMLLKTIIQNQENICYVYVNGSHPTDLVY